MLTGLRYNGVGETGLCSSGTPLDEKYRALLCGRTVEFHQPYGPGQRQNAVLSHLLLALQKERLVRFFLRDIGRIIGALFTLLDLGLSMLIDRA
jgi:hypothetical protein